MGSTHYKTAIPACPLIFFRAEFSSCLYSQLPDFAHFEISLPPVFACHTTRMGLATNTDE
jgi:hypothetical protein